MVKKKSIFNALEILLVIAIFIISVWFVLFNSIYQTFEIFGKTLDVKTIAIICSSLSLIYVIIKLVIKGKIKELDLI